MLFAEGVGLAAPLLDLGGPGAQDPVLSGLLALEPTEFLVGLLKFSERIKDQFGHVASW
jgi:hypothetical protein